MNNKRKKTDVYMNIGVVLVTYNRLDKLKIALESYDKQTLLPKYVLVVNNNSNDGTLEFLKEWEKKGKKYNKYVLNMSENLGGSGGFYTGIKESLALDSEWIWVSDDDAYLEEKTFECLNDYYNSDLNNEKIVGLCGMVINKDDSIALDHRRNIKKGLFKLKQINSKINDYKKESFEINLFSYVGSMMRKETLFKSGITNKDYFIYYDDTEHSYRLSKEGIIKCIPSAKIHHDTLDGGMEYNWKSYYGIRNRLDFIKKNFGKFYYNNAVAYIKLKIFIKMLIRKNSKSELLLQKQAVEDSINNKLGISEIYKPGWKPSK